ncbi:MAG TPA: DinB family protein [Gemmatimonadaceae bacterium]|jgi:uncharacterized damage-inducible protein DinB
MSKDPLRAQLGRLLDWHDAHVSLQQAVDGLAPALRGTRPAGLPYSVWQLLEHIRRAQYDILDFCRNPDYKAMNWPDDYWPAAPEPPSEKAWADSLAAIQRDRKELQKLAADSKVDLLATIPHGEGQTYLRELLLVADHNAYHVGQIVLARRLLGAWPDAS